MRLLPVVLLLVALAPAPVAAQPLPANVCADLVAGRAALVGPPAESDAWRAQLGALLYRVAAAHPPLGVSRKTTGSRCPSPAGDIACDVLMRADGTYWDVFIAKTETATVSCGTPSGVITDAARGWVAAVVATSPAPTEPPPITPPVTDLALTARLRHVEDLQGTIAAQVDALLARLADLEERPVASPCVPREVSTSRALGHGHRVVVCLP